jgi:Pyruvate/2-oxoacid:ferredoxin oxidoreductase delta subunit
VIHKEFRVECDHCGNFTRAATADESEAMRRLAKRGWVERDHGYGNRSQYCNDVCRDNAIKQEDE